ncbi:hypothetical protein HDU76_013053 [Blyttiomyces sp. JEL0837]|nr:hypothetical protein HDU76_013053 [Blyttiomyces sp. JEL0837]
MNTIHISFKQGSIDRGALYHLMRQLPGFKMMAFYNNYVFTVFQTFQNASNALNICTQIPDITSVEFAKQNYELPYPQPDDQELYLQDVNVLHLTHLPPNYSNQEIVSICKGFPGYEHVQFCGKYCYASYRTHTQASQVHMILRTETNLVVTFSRNKKRISPLVVIGPSTANIPATTTITTPTTPTIATAQSSSQLSSTTTLLRDSLINLGLGVGAADQTGTVGGGLVSELNGYANQNIGNNNRGAGIRQSSSSAGNTPPRWYSANEGSTSGGGNYGSGSGSGSGNDIEFEKAPGKERQTIFQIIKSQYGQIPCCSNSSSSSLLVSQYYDDRDGESSSGFDQSSSVNSFSSSTSSSTLPSPLKSSATNNSSANTRRQERARLFATIASIDASEFLRWSYTIGSTNHQQQQQQLLSRSFPGSIGMVPIYFVENELSFFSSCLSGHGLKNGVVELHVAAVVEGVEWSPLQG